ncbi:MAG: hypothetical protein ACR2OG_17600, partial [Gemmatimonadaceae bacterium]
PLGSVFSFVSGLYFRGKLTYARSFARSLGRVPGILVITPTRGLARPEERITRDDLARLGSVPVDLSDPRYREPLEASVRVLAARLPRSAEVVLLGSIATGKYLDVLLQHLGERLLFPADFIGRGDMSRGALLLRAVREQRELAYVTASRAARTGKRVSGLVRAS